MTIEDRKDLFPIAWDDDGMVARLPVEFGIPEYRIEKCTFGWRVYRRKGERSKRLSSPDACRQFIERDVLKAMISVAGRRDPKFWLPMWAAPRNGWACLAKIRDDISEFLLDQRLASWAGQQIVIRHGAGAIAESDLWDMATPSGSAGIPGDWFCGWRPLVVAMPPAQEMKVTAAPAPTTSAGSAVAMHLRRAA